MSKASDQTDLDARQGTGNPGLDLLARVELAYRMAAADECDATDPEPSDSERIGAEIGPWRLLERIGRGGMGEVYRAERADGAYEAHVAVKLLRAGIDASALAQRFSRERQILAKLEHPGIARLIDGGRSAEGLPYLAMELVNGVSLVSYVGEKTLTLNARLQLFLAVCDAVAYAHRNLVVHRDLKPSNILVDEECRIRLLDFGISKLIEDSDEDGATATATGMAPLTVAYAAPEQILGGSITTATDVYALGVLLYEILTGRRPHRREDKTLPALADSVQTESATRPSDLIARTPVAETAPPDRRLARLLRGDLDTIVLTALCPEPERRYASAAVMADDLRRYLDGQPILARPDSTGYRLGKFLRRHRVAVVAVTLVVSALLVGLMTALWQAREARAQAQRAEAVQDFLLDIFRTNSSRQPDPIQARETTARELLDIGAERIGSSLDSAPAAKFAVLTLLGELYHDLAVDDEAVRLRQQAVELAVALHGPQTLATAKALLELAASLHTSAQVSERASVLEQAAAILERHRDPPQDLYAEMLIMRAEHYSSSDVSRALGYAEEAVDRLEGLPPSVRLATAQYSKGVAYNFSGQAEEASRAFARAVEVSRQVQGDPNPALPRYYAMLSETQYRQLDIEGARESSRLAMEAAIAVSGSEHADTLQTTMRLGRLLFDTGSTVDGLAHLARAKQLALDTRGLDDPFHTPQALLEHGYALVRAGDPETGLVDIRAAIDNRRRNRPDTPYLAMMLERAALALIRLDRGDEADALLEEAGQIRDAANQPTGSPVRDENVSLRALRAASQGKAESTLSWLSQHSAYAGGQGLQTTDQVGYLLLRAELTWLLNDTDDAVAAAQEALEAISALGMDQHLALQRARALLVLGQSLNARGDLVRGCDALQKALEIRQAQLLPVSQQLAETRSAVEVCD